jgi:hypothetical protein
MTKSRLLAAAAALWLAVDLAHAQCVVGTNRGLSLDGGDHVAVPYSASLAGFGNFTFEAWGRRTGLSASGFGAILTKWNYPAVAEYSFTTGAASVLLSGAGGTQLITAPFVFDANWHHFAVTRTGSTLQLFIDGALAATTTHAANLGNAATSYPTRIGTSSAANAFSGMWVGDLDEVRVWNVGRTQAQIQAAMTVGLGGAEPGLVGYWRFDEASGQTVFNATLAAGPALDGSLGANALPGADDPARISSGLPPLPYCSPCPSPPCGQVNSSCATLTVNGVGAGAQGPFNVVVPPSGTLSFDWSGPAGQPYVLIATPELVPGQVVFPPSFVVDVNVGNYFLLFSGFDAVWGPLYFTNASGVGQQTWLHPGAVPFGVTMNVQGLMYDLALTCGSGLPFMTTASFAIQL